jgi:hypothetical protein
MSAFKNDFRPPLEFDAVPRRRSPEVETYARLIAERGGDAFDVCLEQAELQLWASNPTRPRKISLRTLDGFHGAVALPR